MKILKVISIGLAIWLVLLAAGLMLEYLKVIVSWPGATLMTVVFVTFIVTLFFQKKTESKYIEVESPKPEVTGFISVLGHTNEGDVIIKSEKTQKIQDGDVVVNKGFILRFFDDKMELKKLRLELKKYQEKLLEK
jgi:hypothetical protein